MNSIALEAQQLVKRAAEPVTAGESIKSQMRRAWERLGRPAWWRVRAAWYGEAGCWSAAAIEDLRGRARRLAEREESKGRAEAEKLAAILSRIATADADNHPHLDRAEIARARELVRRLGAPHRAGAGGEP